MALCEIGNDVEGSRLRLPEASQTPPGAASSRPSKFWPSGTASDVA